ncbi:phosphomannomutase/phosphoglucomutase [Variovorax sp. Varisp62]|uniref:phosphomannomutase/phosphoglucomutase n=1 Tax=Variovorax sp. Varisp62 TaxID=3243049 RepID=UPI0039B5B1CB
MNLNESLFKTYDIRGSTLEGLSAELARGIGRAFGSMAWTRGERVIAVGRDGRLSSPELAQALRAGLGEAGMEVIDLGMVTTPMLYFATHTICRSGIEVTGSHNPGQDNGFKMVLAEAPFFGDDVQTLKRIIQSEAWVLRSHRSSRRVDILPAYRQRIICDICLARPLRVVVDAGNGIAGASTPSILRAIGCEVEELHTEVDGRFPNHHPDPSRPENLRDLIAAVQSGEADLGLAFDGDGDRLGVVTRSGANIVPDRQIMLFARDVLARHGGATIVFDVKCSQQLAPWIHRFGGRADMYKSGHSLVRSRMMELGALLGGEMSGHIFFKERWFGFDDGTYTACRLLEIVSAYANAGAVLETLPDALSTPEIHVPCTPVEATDIMHRLVQGSDCYAPAVVTNIDGLRIDWSDGFGLVRPSNTNPVLVLRFEGVTQSALERIASTLWQQVKAIKPNAKPSGWPSNLPLVD